MPLRSEEAEIKRALELSTQHDAVLARTPHTLSSGVTTDSRDLELRPIQATGRTMTATLTTPTPATRVYDERQPLILSPDSPKRAHHPSSRRMEVEVVIPLRTPSSRVRETSADPIDMLASSPVKERPLQSTSSESAVVSQAREISSNVAAEPSRVSSRQKKIQEDKAAAEAAAKAERKRKREERKAAEAAAAADKASASTAAPSKKAEKTSKSKKAASSSVTDSASSSTSSARASTSSQQPGVVTAGEVQLGSSSEPSPKRVKKNASPEKYVESSSASPSKEAEVGPSSSSSASSAQLRDTTPAMDSPHFSPVEAATSDISTPLAGPPAPPVTTTASEVSTPTASRPLQATRTTPVSVTPNGRPWKTARNDLSSVLSKFPRAKATGMSKRLNIAPLHRSIGPGVKALPPPPPKNRKKAEEEEDDDEETEGKIKVGSKEWLMMED